MYVPSIDSKLLLLCVKGKHSKYWLNERKKIMLYWARVVLESGPQPDVAITSLPAYANNRQVHSSQNPGFGIIEKP